MADVAATVNAWPTQTPYPTYTAVFIDLEDPTEVPTAVPTVEEVVSEDTTEIVDAEVIEVEEPTSTPYPTLAPETETPEPVVKDNYEDERSGAEMIYIPAGNFMLGSNPNEDPYANLDEEGPQIRVYLDGYWMNKTEVTNAQYLRCVQAGVCDQGYYMALYMPGLEDYPVSYVTVDQAERFCSWIGGHLPTEYQWEKAARGTEGRIYPWGNNVPTLENDLANIPNYVDANGEGEDLFPVGSFPKGASPYGLLDMAGNVWEWTSTWFSENYYQELEAEAELSGEPVRNPTGPEDGDAHVMRGGSCASTEVNNYEAFMRTANRGYLNISSSYYVGFRCAVPDTGEAPYAVQPGGPGEPGPEPLP